jgi:hypothetical protein
MIRTAESTLRLRLNWLNSCALSMPTRSWHRLNRPLRSWRDRPLSAASPGQVKRIATLYNGSVSNLSQLVATEFRKPASARPEQRARGRDSP